MSDPIVPVLDDDGFVVQDENGIYLDDLDALGEAFVRFRIGGTGDIVYDDDQVPVIDDVGYVVQDENGVYLDDVGAAGVALSTGRFGATGDIIYSS
jgi:hypothetical protein